MSSKWTGTPLKDKTKYKWRVSENLNIYNQYYYFQKTAYKNSQTCQTQKYKITKNNFVPLNNLVQDVIC